MLKEHQLNQIAFIIEKAIASNLKYHFYVDYDVDNSYDFSKHYKFTVEYFGKRFFFSTLSGYKYDLGFKADLNSFRKTFGSDISDIVTKLKAHEVSVGAQMLIDNDPMFKDLF